MTDPLNWEPQDHTPPPTTPTILANIAAWSLIFGLCALVWVLVFLGIKAVL